MIISAPSLTTSLSPGIRLFSRYDSIPLEPNVLWRIERGVVRTITWDEEGKLMILGYWGTGDVVGQPLSRIVPYQIECLSAVETTILPQPLWDQVVDAIFLHVQQTEKLLSILHQKSVVQRLWQLLLLLSQKFGRDLESGRMLDLVLTQQQMADTINTTRVTVTRSLQQLQVKGMLQRRQRRLILCQRL